MQRQDHGELFASYLVAGLAVILFLSAWAVGVSRSCRSDGCIGIWLPIGGALIALLVQVFILVPLFCLRLHRSRLPFGKLAAIWVGVSVASFAVPMLFAKL